LEHGPIAIAAAPFGKRGWRVARTRCSPLRERSLAHTRCSPLPWAVEECAVGPPRLPRLLQKPGDRIRQIVITISTCINTIGEAGCWLHAGCTKRSHRNAPIFTFVSGPGSARTGVGYTRATRSDRIKPDSDAFFAPILLDAGSSPRLNCCRAIREAGCWERNVTGVTWAPPGPSPDSSQPPCPASPPAARRQAGGAVSGRQRPRPGSPLGRPLAVLRVSGSGGRVSATRTERPASGSWRAKPASEWAPSSWPTGSSVTGRLRVMRS
jgi:hypothetical protein